MNVFLFLAGIFIVTFLLGRILERFRIPWVFSALLIGSLMAINNPFGEITSSQTLSFLAQLGMYFLLFIIGFEMDLRKIMKKSRFIFKATFFIILFETLFGSLIVHYVFGYEWLVSFLVALSFATVGEAVLIPILDEFKLIRKPLGQTIIGVGTLDDVIEAFTLILMVVIIGSHAQRYVNLPLVLISLFILFILTFGLTRLKKEGEKFSVLNIETLFLFVIFVFFLFVGIGEFAESAALASLLAGISLRTFIPEKRLKFIESEIKTMCYGFFAPIFFLWVGLSMDMKYLFSSPLLVLLVIVVSVCAKILGSYIIGKKEIGKKNSILLGIGLSVRFSTSMAITKILFDAGIIGSELYSAIIASTMVITFIIPVLFSKLVASMT